MPVPLEATSSRAKNPRGNPEAMSRATELTMPSWLCNTVRTARDTVRAALERDAVSGVLVPSVAEFIKFD